jgi:hypothetical protein
LDNYILQKDGAVFWISNKEERLIKVSGQGKNRIVSIYPTEREIGIGVVLKRVRWSYLEVAGDL